MSRRVAITHPPKGGAIIKDESKYKTGSDPLEIETTLKEMEPTSSQEHKEMLDVVNLMISDQRVNSEEKKALQIWKANLLASTIGPHVKKEFVRDFWAWLCGRAKDSDAKRTPWGRQPLTDDPQVEAYVSLFPRKMQAYRIKLFLLANRRPLGINECFLYFKYIVRGDFTNKEAFDSDFLKDWQTFGEDFDEAREDGQGYRRPKGSAHEMAPYDSPDGDAAAEQAARKRSDNNRLPSMHGFGGGGGGSGGGGRRDDDMDISSSSEDEDDFKGGEKEPARRSERLRAKHARGDDPNVEGVHENPTNEGNTAQAFAREIGPILKQILADQGKVIIEGLAKQQRSETAAELSAKASQAKTLEEDFLKKVEAARLARQEEPGPSEELTAAREALAAAQMRSTMQEQRIVELIAAAARREEQHEQTTRELHQNIIQTLEQRTAAGEAKTALLTEKILKFADDSNKRTDQLVEQFTSGFGETQEFAKKLQEEQARVSDIVAKLQEVSSQKPDDNEVLRATTETMRTLLRTKQIHDMLSSPLDEETLLGFLSRDDSERARAENANFVASFTAAVLRESENWRGAKEYRQAWNRMRASALPYMTGGMPYANARAYVLGIRNGFNALLQSRMESEDRDQVAGEEEEFETGAGKDIYDDAVEMRDEEEARREEIRTAEIAMLRQAAEENRLEKQKIALDAQAEVLRAHEERAKAQLRAAQEQAEKERLQGEFRKLLQAQVLNKNQTAQLQQRLQREREAGRMAQEEAQRSQAQLREFQNFALQKWNAATTEVQQRFAMGQAQLDALRSELTNAAAQTKRRAAEMAQLQTLLQQFRSQAATKQNAELEQEQRIAEASKRNEELEKEQRAYEENLRAQYEKARAMFGEFHAMPEYQTGWTADEMFEVIRKASSVVVKEARRLRGDLRKEARRKAEKPKKREASEEEKEEQKKKSKEKTEN